MNNLSITTNFRRLLGAMGEELGTNYLVSMDWEIECRNFSAHRTGEIDIIGRPPGANLLAFIEVKTRQLTGFAADLDHPGQQSVHGLKQKHLRRTAAAYLASKAQWESGVRFDILLVDINLNYRDLNQLLILQDGEALRPHCRFSHIVDIMGNF